MSAFGGTADIQLIRFDVRFWPIATFRCVAEFGRYRGIADFGKPSARQIYGFTA
jgi:hypothetical protein